MYVQALRAWAGDLVECLAVKSAIVEELEEARYVLLCVCERVLVCHVRPSRLGLHGLCLDP